MKQVYTQLDSGYFQKVGPISHFGGVFLRAFSATLYIYGRYSRKQYKRLLYNAINPFHPEDDSFLNCQLSYEVYITDFSSSIRVSG